MAGEDAFEVQGTEAFQRLGKALKAASDGGEMRKALLRELRAAGKPVTAKVRAELGAQMPRKGGLAARMAKAKVATRNKLSGDSAGVTIQTSVTGYDLPAIERGRLRHPTFGHAPWVNQTVPAGVVTKAVESQVPAMREAVLDAIESVLDELARAAE